MKPEELSPAILWSTSIQRFALTSGLTFMTNFVGTVFLHEIVGIPTNVAYGVALALVFLQSFVLLRYYVYGPQSEPAVRQFLKYAPSAVGFRGLEFAAFVLLHNTVGIDYRIVICIIAAGSFVAKFLYYRWAVFRG